MAKDDNGREGFSAGAMSKDLGISPAKVKKVLSELGVEPDFVKSGCNYYYAERTAEVRKAVGKP